MNANRTVTLEGLARQHLPNDVTLEVDPSARHPFTAYNVVGSFPDAEAARTAVHEAQSAGVASERTSILLVGGRPVRDDQGGGSVGPDPEGVTGYTMKRVVPGAVIGGVVGAGGVAVAAGLIGSVEGGELIAATIGGGGFFAAVGGLIGAFTGFSDTDAWRSTFTDLRNEVALVAVHVDGTGDADAARQRFDRAGARKTWLFDGEGRPVGGRGRR